MLLKKDKDKLSPSASNDTKQNTGSALYEIVNTLQHPVKLTSPPGVHNEEDDCSDNEKSEPQN